MIVEKQVFNFPTLKVPCDFPYIKKNSARIFEDKIFLKIYDEILLQSDHYQDILSSHYSALKHCSNIIDLGCGTGNLLTKFNKHSQTLTGIDSSAVSLNRLYHKSHQSQNINLFSCNLSKRLPFIDDIFDGISSMIVAHLLDDIEKHIKESHRILKPNGTFILTARDYNGKDENIIDIVKHSLEKKDLLKEKRSDFNQLCDRLLLTANKRSPSLMTAADAVFLCMKTGYKNIQLLPNKTSKVMYSIKAIK